MKTLNYIFILPFLIITSQAFAQTAIVKKFVRQVDLSHNISYTSITNNETPFGDSKDTIKAYMALNSSDAKNYSYIFKTSNEKDIFNGEQLLTLYLTDKTYIVNTDYRYSAYYFNSLVELATAVKDALKKFPQRFKELPDTVINHVFYYHVKFVTQDTLIHQKHAYTIYNLCFNKDSYLPKYVENRQQGYLEKGGVVSEDVFQVIKRNAFLHYELNSIGFPDFAAEKIPSDFKPANSSSSKPQPLLASGIKAPDWQLEDIKGSKLSSSELKGKLTIIDFSSNYCGECILAIPTMNRLREKYKHDDNIKFVTIDIDDSKETIAKFIQKYKINFPIYINGKKVKETYNVAGIPTFYVISKQGLVANTFDGFSEGLEKSIESVIEENK